MLLNVLIFSADIISRHLSLATCGLVESCEDMHGCCLARSVGSEETEYLPFFHRKRYVVHCTELTEGLDEMLHLDDILFIRHVACRLALNCRGIEYVAKAVKNDLGRVNTLHPTLVEKCHTLAPSYLVKIGSGGNDSDTTLLEHGEHIPKLLAAHGVNTRCGFVEEKHRGLVYQGA